MPAVRSMNFTAVIERDLSTGVLVGSVPGIPGAHSQGANVEELRHNLVEVLELLRDAGALAAESEVVAITRIAVA